LLNNESVRQTDVSTESVLEACN